MPSNKTEPKPKRKGGLKKTFKTFISFADEFRYKAALIQYARNRVPAVTFSVVCREMVALYIKTNKIEVPADNEAAEKIVREFSTN